MKYYVNENIKKIDILDSFAVWLNKTSKKSNQSLIDYINETGHKELQIVVD